MTGVGWLDVVLAVIIGLVIWRLSIAVIRMLSTPPPEVDPDDIVTTDQDYKCTVCGAELTHEGDQSRRRQGSEALP